MTTLSDAIKQVKPSPTLAATARAQELQAAGRDVVSFTCGEPDFDTPQHVKDAALKAMNEGFTKYTAVPGILPLRKALAEKFKRDQGIEYKPNDIIVTNGGKQAIAAACAVLLNKGDEAVFTAPYWTSYPDMVALAGGKPVVVNTKAERGYVPSGKDIADVCTAKTKLVILNSPSNPTGACYSKEEMKEICEAVRSLPNGKDIVILSDEVYEYITYGDAKSWSPLQVCPDMRDQVLVVNAFSKAYSMTGWRVGYAAGPEWLIKAIGTHQSQFTTNVCSIAQRAAAAAYEDDYAFPKMMVQSFTRRLETVLKAVDEMPGISIPVKPKGAFYGFLRIEGLLGKSADGFTINSGSDFMSYLIERYDVVTVQGEAFGDKNAVRMSYALDDKTLEKGLTRMIEACAKLR